MGFDKASCVSCSNECDRALLLVLRNLGLSSNVDSLKVVTTNRRPSGNSLKSFYRLLKLAHHTFTLFEHLQIWGAHQDKWSRRYWLSGPGPWSCATCIFSSLP